MSRLTVDQWESDQWPPSKPGHPQAVVDYLCGRLDYLEPAKVYTYVCRQNGNIPGSAWVTFQEPRWADE